MPAASVRRESFGTLPGGRTIDGYTLTNPCGIEVRVLAYGAILQSIRVSDRGGRLDDVVLGYDSLAGYVRYSPYFGAVVGRYGNRIANGTFTLDGTAYRLATNNGRHHLHGGVAGFDKAVWTAQPFQRDGGVGVALGYTSPDGAEGYPGSLAGRVTSTLPHPNHLILDDHPHTA